MSNQPALPSEIVPIKHQGNQEVAADQQGQLVSCRMAVWELLIVNNRVAATQPGSGKAIPSDIEHSANVHADQHAQADEKLPFKEQVKGTAY